jgi:hypothetical protein
VTPGAFYSKLNVLLDLKEQLGLEYSWAEKPITENLLARQPDLGCRVLLLVFFLEGRKKDNFLHCTPPNKLDS